MPALAPTSAAPAAPAPSPRATPLAHRRRPRRHRPRLRPLALRRFPWRRLRLRRPFPFPPLDRLACSLHPRLVRRHLGRAPARTPPLRRALLGDHITDTGCSLKLFRREVAASFLPIRALSSFLPAFAAAAHRPRVAGVSKYGLRTMAFHPLFDLLALSWILRRTLRRP